MNPIEPTTISGGAGRETLATPKRIVVVGGGLAGCAAATVLAEKGAQVHVVESCDYLGGRVGGWADQLENGHKFTMERGFHAFFRQYYNLRAWLQRFDENLDHLTPLHDYPIFGPNGRQESFANLPIETPQNLITLVNRTSTLGLADLVKIPTWPTLEMLSYDRERTFREYDGTSAGEFLDSLRFPPEARQMLFDVFAHSFFNPQYGMSAAEMIKLFHFYFTGNPEGLIFDVLDQSFATGIWDPVRSYLDEHSVKFSMNTKVEQLVRHKTGWRLLCKGQRKRIDCDAVVLAVTANGLKSIVAESPDLNDADWRNQVDSLGETLPFVVWRLWLDRASAPGREAFVGTAGMGMLDNISLYHLFQDESRDYVREHGGSVVELHAYAVDGNPSEAEIKADLWRHFIDVYPEYIGANIKEERYRVDQDCPSFKPGDFSNRPGVETPFDGLTLAGDFVRVDLPVALMEGAVTSGFLAANHFLNQWGVRGETLRSVPARGLLSDLAPRLNSKRPAPLAPVRA